MSKVLILSLGRKGGCVRYAKEIINCLYVDKDVYVSKYCIEEKPNSSKSIYTYKGKLQFIANTLFYYPFFIGSIFFKVLFGKYQTLYVPYFQYWGIVPLLIFKLFRKNVISTIHDGIMHSGDGLPFEQALNKVYIKKASKLVFLTEHVNKLVQRAIPFKGEAHVIPHGILKPIGVNSAPRNLNENPTIIFLGRINQYKGVEDLALAVLQLPNESFNKLIIAGKTSYNIELPKSHKIEFIDKWLNENELSVIVNKADIMVLPYREATQSGIITIGIAAGLPMVCTNVGGLSEQLIPNKEAIFVESNADSIKQGILTLLNDSKKYNEISKNLIEKANTLKWDSIAGQISTLFK